MTIWGQSAGAGSVLQHLVAHRGNTQPALFHAAMTSSTFLPSQYKSPVSSSTAGLKTTLALPEDVGPIDPLPLPPLLEPLTVSSQVPEAHSPRNGSDPSPSAPPSRSQAEGLKLKTPPPSSLQPWPTIHIRCRQQPPKGASPYLTSPHTKTTKSYTCTIVIRSRIM